MWSPGTQLTYLILFVSLCFFLKIAAKLEDKKLYLQTEPDIKETSAKHSNNNGMHDDLMWTAEREKEVFFFYICWFIQNS